jgi:suppressor for copper-sensitivity B
MLHLRRILGAALIVTALWLATVVAVLSGAAVALALFGLMAAALALLWSARRMPENRRWLRPVGVVGLGLIVVLIPLQFRPPAAAPGSAASEKSLDWRAFEPGAIPRLIAEGQTVFVDVTADWCITCQVNKALVIGRGEVAHRLTAANTIRMRADWTKPDDEIARYLQSFGRYGIPFNVVYGPADPGGIPLPEILTAEVVLQALDRAGGRPTR